MNTNNTVPCPKCGAPSPQNSSFCAKCGTPLSSLPPNPSKPPKRTFTLCFFIFGYLIVFAIIGIGFIVGNGYTIHKDTKVAPRMSSYWLELYGYQALNEMFDGYIDMHTGWYGLHWKNTYSFYQDSNITEEDYETFCTVVYNLPEGYTEWSEAEYVTYISDFDTYCLSDLNYVWMRLDDDFVLIEFAPTNAETNPEDVIPIIALICAALCALPPLAFIPVTLLKKKGNR